MKLGQACFALSLAAATAAFAQGTLGTVADVQGLATVTTGTSGAAVAPGPGAPIANGSRVITTSTGRVTLRLNNGCVVTVPPGHAVTVLSTMSCQQLAAAVTPVATTVTTAPALVPTGTMGANSANAGIVNGAIAAGAIGILAGIIAYESDDDDIPLSPR